MSFEKLGEAIKNRLKQLAPSQFLRGETYYHDTEEYIKKIEVEFDAFKKQEQQKQNLTEEDALSKVKSLKRDFEFARKRSPNFCDGVVRGFREGYVQRGKELLEGET